MICVYMYVVPITIMMAASIWYLRTNHPLAGDDAKHFGKWWMLPLGPLAWPLYMVLVIDEFERRDGLHS